MYTLERLYAPGVRLNGEGAARTLLHDSHTRRMIHTLVLLQLVPSHHHQLAATSTFMARPSRR